MTNTAVNTTVTVTASPVLKDLWDDKQLFHNNPFDIRYNRLEEVFLNWVVLVNISTGAKCDKIHQDIVVITRLMVD